jgi:hypothetical protein
MRTLPVLALAALTAGLLAAQTLTNPDLIKLAGAGLSEQFILDMVQKEGGRLSADVSSLIELKQGGVSERIITAVVNKAPAPAEAPNTDSVLRLVKAGFSDNFVIDLLNRRPGKFDTSAARIIELKNAGVSERLLAQMVSQGSGRELAAGTEIVVRLIDPVDSEVNKAGDEFRASLDEPITLGTDVIAPKGADAKVRLVNTEESGRLRGRTSLTLQLVSVTINGRPVEINSTDVQQYSGSRGARTAKTAAAVGAVGAVIGAIAGGGKGAAIGAATGAGAGAGATVLLDPQRVKVPSETLLTFLTERPARLP